VIKSIAITSNDKYLFTSDLAENGHVKQLSVRNGQLIKDYGQNFGDNGVLSIILTSDNKWLFSGSSKGHLKQISLETQQVVHDYGKIHDTYNMCLETTRDSKWLIFAC
jgi:WD40 repeat protein